jgi:hypothetical protein
MASPTDIPHNGNGSSTTINGSLARGSSENSDGLPMNSSWLAIVPGNYRGPDRYGSPGQHRHPAHRRAVCTVLAARPDQSEGHQPGAGGDRAET